jgi:mannose-6-phosphate isomerase-like protein (cupin superfamily)
MAPSDFFNIFTAEYAKLEDAGFGAAESRILYNSADGRSLIIATRYPEGAKFKFAPHGYQEVFYIAGGTGTRTFASGESLAIDTGDLIFVHEDEEVEYVFEPGFIDVTLFWSDTPLDPALTSGLPSHVTAK